MHKRMRALIAIPMSLLSVALGVAQATVAPFEGITDHFALLQGSGDRVNGPVHGGFPFGGTGTYTPSVIVAFGSVDSGQSYPLSPGTAGFNDLIDVVYAPSGTELQVTLTASRSASCRAR
jgi:hypothetical protein